MRENFSARDETMEMVMYCERAMKECERISTVEKGVSNNLELYK